jgi:protein-tyrosine phosphatase
VTVVAPSHVSSAADPTDLRRVTHVISRTLDLLKHVYRSVRNLPDKALHRRRHARARGHLAEIARPRTILVVCHGNICRSPYFQAVLQRDLPDIVVGSAGFVGSDRPVPELSLVVSAERGFNLSRFRSRPVTGAAAAAADLIIVMDPRQAKNLRHVFNVPARKILIAGDLDPTTSETRAIADPWHQPIAAFRSAFDRLDRCAVTLTAVLGAAR